MKTSTAAVPDQSLPPRAALGVLQPPASAPSIESAGERSALSALMDAKLAADREIQRLSARVHQLSAQLAAADEHARRSLAQDLHDDAGSALTAARFALARIETWLPGDAPAPCAEALDIARQSLDAACEANHRAVAGLHAPSFDGGVGRALADWTARFAAGTSLRVAFACSADERLAQLPDATALAVFRVAQEALNNVARHARATEAAVSIDADARFLTLVVTRRRHRHDGRCACETRTLRLVRHARALRRARRQLARHHGEGGRNRRARAFPVDDFARRRVGSAAGVAGAQLVRALS